MNRIQNLTQTKQPSNIFKMLSFLCAILIISGVLTTKPDELIRGMRAIVTSPSGLLTDYFAIAGIGAAFVNSGLVGLLSLLLLKKLKITLNGMSIAAVMIMLGFSLFGKNIINILPILLGNYLYAKTQKERWSRYIYIGLFSTCLAPFVSVLYWEFENPMLGLIVGVFVGIIAGFLTPAIAPHTATIHMGYNLFNVGFAAGFLGLIMMAFLRGFGIDNVSVLHWQEGIEMNLAAAVYIFCLFLFGWGVILIERDFKRFLRLYRHSGRAVADFVFMDGLGATFMNMGIMGAFSLTVIILIGGDLNGPTLGAILTVTGFSAFGMHLKNSLPIISGVILGALLMRYELTAAGVQLALLFSLGVAPIAGQFGYLYGITAGVVHSAIALSISSVYGAMNLYNNGFSAGIVAMVLVPVIESFRKEV